MTGAQEDGLAATREAAERLTGVFAALRRRGVEHATAQRAVLGCALECFRGDASAAPWLGAEERAIEPELWVGVRGCDWPRVQLSVFGALLQACMDPARRHAFGAHFTSEADIERVVEPTIVRPWRARIAAAEGVDALQALRRELAAFRVLDPACGSGNFLYVALRALQRLEVELVAKMGAPFGEAMVGARQMWGIERDGFAAALARLTLGLADRRCGAELADNVQEGDALFMAWPVADAIVGNPPFQAKNKMQAVYGPEYLAALRARYPGVPGLADYCVYWFRRAHDELAPGGRAGLVGTNTIRQNASRIGGLAYILKNGGEIVDAVASQVWSGDAAVHVSAVNWVKGGAEAGLRRLAWQEGNARGSPWRAVHLPRIGASLSAEVEVGGAQALRANVAARRCFQGQTHGHEGFLLTPEEAAAWIASDRRNAEVLFPLLTGEDLLGRPDGSASRWVIDFGERSLEEIQRDFSKVFARVEARVLPDRAAARGREELRNAGLGTRINRHHASFHARWWALSWRRPELLAALGRIDRYVVCVRLSRRPLFEMVAAGVRPSDALVVFAFADDYSFGILQSSWHWRWLVARCSTLKADYRYTSRSVFDAFAWPQAPGTADIAAVAAAGRHLRAVRAELLRGTGKGRRALYTSGPGAALQDAQAGLDEAVRAAYGAGSREDPLAHLLALNLQLAAAERAGAVITGSGSPGLEGAGLVARERGDATAKLSPSVAQPR